VLRIKNLIICAIFFLIYIGLVPPLNSLLHSLLAGAGITAIIIGFAAKSTITNFIAGLSLAIYRPFRLGDKVMIEGEYATIEEITLRHTIIRNLQNKRIIIPNSRLDEMTLINYSIIDPRGICAVDLGVSYDTDIDLARSLILQEVNRCPYRDMNAEDPLVRVISHGNFSIRIRVYVWVSEPDNLRFVRFWLLENIKKRFDIEGIEIPFPYRTLVYKKDLPLPRRLEELNTVV
jgi:small-conductance mechanosensitive channel